MEWKAALANDSSFLTEMLYEAVYWRALGQGTAPALDDFLGNEVLLQSMAGWGARKGDLGLIASDGFRNLGAVWIRYYQKDNAVRGFINETVPVLVIGIGKEFRNQGIGTGLINALFEKAAERGVQSISLMVSKDNYALKLYKKTGFEILQNVEDSYLMIKKL